jgi:hypothetical protein
MKRLSLIAIAATILSTNTFAGDHTINAIGRTGWIFRDHDSNSVSNSSSFNIDFLRTTFAGVVTPSVKYYITIDLLAANGTTDAIDSTSTFIDEAFVTKTFSTATSITLGKKAVLIGGREYDYLDYDRYTSSGFKNATPSNQVGLTVSQDIAGNSFIAQYFNGNKNNGTTGTNAQSKFGYALGWYGNFLDGAIKPIAAYTVVPEAANSLSTLGTTSRVSKGNDNFLAAGLQFNLPMGFTLEADYNLLTEKDAAGTATTKQDLKTTSIVGLVRYTTDRFAPFFKIISDTSKLASTKTGSRLAYDAGLEFKESKDDMLRYHIVYSRSTVKTNINTTTVKTSPSSILAGVKFDAAILK